MENPMELNDLLDHIGELWFVWVIGAVFAGGGALDIKERRRRRIINLTYGASFEEAAYAERHLGWQVLFGTLGAVFAILLVFSLSIHGVKLLGAMQVPHWSFSLPFAIASLAFFLYAAVTEKTKKLKLSIIAQSGRGENPDELEARGSLLTILSVIGGLVCLFAAVFVAIFG